MFEPTNVNRKEKTNGKWTRTKKGCIEREKESERVQRKNPNRKTTIQRKKNSIRYEEKH